ncbi:MAG: Ldh family oxidoreductase [Deltaproteobacteria bacterium]|nr:Ldh family oxidoreductase [Deltaproteobacteria bacterium]
MPVGEPAGATAVGADWLEAVMTRALASRGLSPEHQAAVVEGLLEASLRGVDTHGVRLFPTYLKELDGGRAAVRPQMTWQENYSSAHLLDAGSALGLVAGRTACQRATELARNHGVGAVVVRNSNHFGPASAFTLWLARQGLIGLCCTNSDALVAPFQGVEALLGTNPISCAVAGEGDDVFCLDMATSQVSYSCTKIFREEGRPLEPRWAVDATGQDCASTEAGSPSALLPLGGYKGQGLGMAVSLLCALLAQEPLDDELSHLFAPPYDRGRRVSHFFLALNIGAFSDEERFRSRLSSWLRQFYGSEPSGDESVSTPGAQEARVAAHRGQNGIPLKPELLEWFRRVEGEGSGVRQP